MSRIMGTTYDGLGTGRHVEPANFLAVTDSAASRLAPSIRSGAPGRIPVSPTSKPPAQLNDTIGTGPRRYRSGLGERDELNDEARSRGEIVVIHRCTFYRDCFARCLELIYETHDISAYDAIDRWIGASSRRALPPDAIVVFFHGDHASDSNDLRSLEAVAPSTPVIVLSDNEDIDQISQIIRNGARGYIPTSLPFNLAVEAVRFVVAGGTFVPASHFRSDRTVNSKDAIHLTDRQTMVLGALCKGMANKQIAYHLGMSEHTVKIHLRHIMRRLNARNRTEAAMLARSHLASAGLHDGSM